MLQIISSDESPKSTTQLRVGAYEEQELAKRLDGQGSRLVVGREVEAYRKLCTAAAAEAIIKSTDPADGCWLRRRLAANRVICCMEYTSRLDVNSDVIVSVITEPGCAGCGETISAPDLFIAEAVAAQIAIIMCDPVPVKP